MPNPNALRFRNNPFNPYDEFSLQNFISSNRERRMSTDPAVATQNDGNAIDQAAEQDDELASVFEVASSEVEDPVIAALEEEGVDVTDPEAEVAEPYSGPSSYAGYQGQEYGELANELGGAFDEVSPSERVTDLTTDQESRLSQLTARANRLQQIGRTEEPISRGIQGNPFSITIGPGLKNLAIAGINQERRRRVQGDPELVERSMERLQELEGREAELQEQLATTSSTVQQRRIERELKKIDKRKARANRRIDKYEGIADELTGLTAQQKSAEEARKRNLDRDTRREDFILDNVGKALETEVKTKAQMEEEQLKSYNKYQLQERLYELKDSLEKTKGKFGSANGRSEYASAVNNYAKTFLMMADSYDNDIKASQKLLENYSTGRYYYTQEDVEAGTVPEGTDPDLIAPEGVRRSDRSVGDPEALRLQSVIENAKKEKQAVVNQALDIYENSTVLSEDTRVLRPPTEEDKQMIQEMKDKGFTSEQVEKFAKGLGFDYDPAEFRSKYVNEAGTDFNYEAIDSVDTLLAAYEEVNNIKPEQLLARIMETYQLASEEEARAYLKEQLESKKAGTNANTE